MSRHVQADQRSRLLQALGVGPIWLRRDAAKTAEPNIDTAPSMPPTVDSGIEVKAATRPSAVSAWDDVPQAVPAPAAAVAPTPVPTFSDAEIAAMDWASLQAAVAGCTRCPLCRTRSRTVFGVGDLKARWLFVGEGPGRLEDQSGEPFVGPAGKLLDNLLQAIDLKRSENSYIANVVKCRATDADGHDRAPSAAESAACRPYLDRQIALLKPTTIVALGKVAALTLLQSDPKTPVAALRGIVHQLGGVPLVVTYHPAYLLRKPLDKAKSWRDLCLATEAYRNFGKLVV